MDYAFRVEPGSKISLKDYDADFKGDLKKEDAAEHFDKYQAELRDLQELLYAAGHHSVLIILQGMDTSGKDGTVRHVMSAMNPQGCDVVSFKAPSEEELSHDFLWRVHHNVPPLGKIGIFNRSHYEDVLIVRVHNLVPPKIWQARYDHINNFEKLLTDSNTIVLKFFLHISKEEQLERLEAREAEPDKRWKLNWGDYKEREFWKDYQEAYEDLLTKCSTKHAPWFIVPANRKWYRNLAVAETLVEQLRPYRDEWQQELEARGAKAMAVITSERARLNSSNGKRNKTATVLTKP